MRTAWLSGMPCNRSTLTRHIALRNAAATTCERVFTTSYYIQWGVHKIKSRLTPTSSMEPRPWFSDEGSNTRNLAVSHDRRGHWRILEGALAARSGYCHASRRR